MSFHFESEIAYINNYYIIKVPLSMSLKFPSRGMVMAEGTLNDCSISIPLEPDGRGCHWFAIDESVLVRGNIKVGEVVLILLELTENWCEPILPVDILRALENNQLVDYWYTLTTRTHWDWFRWIRSTKVFKTREKRIKTMCSKLSSGDRRPCCFNRNSCSVTDVCKSGILQI